MGISKAYFALMNAYSHQHHISCGQLGICVKVTVRFLQIITGFAIVGIFAHFIGKHRTSRPEWIFATTTGLLSAVTGVVFIIPSMAAPFQAFYWDLVLAIFHVILAVGIIGKAFLSAKIKTGLNGEQLAALGMNVDKMRKVEYLVIVSGCLWLLTALAGGLIFMKQIRANKDAQRVHALAMQQQQRNRYPPDEGEMPPPYDKIEHV
jgi:hypothetical protein